MAEHPLLGDLGHLWPAFVGAVNDPEIRAQPGGVQQYVWAALRNDYLGRGENLPPDAFARVNAGISLAAEQRRAALALQSAAGFVARTGIDQGIGSAFISRAVDARDLGNRAGDPLYRVIYTAGVIVDGVLVDMKWTHDAGAHLPGSVATLSDTIDQAAQAQAADYGYEYVGASAVDSIQTY